MLYVILDSTQGWKIAQMQARAAALVWLHERFACCAGRLSTSSASGMACGAQGEC